MTFSHFTLIFTLALLVQRAVAAEPATTADVVRREATLPNRGELGRPLPLAGHWNGSGAERLGFTPQYQLEQINKGHHLLPWLEWPPTDRNLESMFKKDDKRREKYIDDRLKELEPVIKELARQRLPISFLATQWESNLTYDKAYFNLPPDKNPNVVGTDGKVRGQVCPFGPIEPWREVGKSWTDGLFMKRIQEWYPDPPLVLLISNNEHGKLQWTEAEQSQRYLDKFGKGKSDDFKRKVIGDGWIERYTALLDGVRSGLANETWRKNAKMVGYEAFPPVHFGRWAGWTEYSLYCKGRLDPFPLCWDGGSPSYYLHNWMALTDYTVWSPQVETMNWVFMLDDVHKVRPEFWFELSTWDGDQPGVGNDKRRFYAKQGHIFTPARYEGFVQYGMWLTRPRVVREFRGHLETIEYAGAYFQAIMDAVDRPYRNETLQTFWRKGTLVANTKGKHPFSAGIPDEFKDAQRWFLLDTNLTPKELRPEEFDNAKPPARMTEIPIFALAMVMGSAPEREWLVYAHAPKGARPGVAITVPEYGAITVDVPQSGSFFLVKEKGKQVETVHQGGPASFRVEAPRFVEVNAPAAFSVEDKYGFKGAIDAVKWNLDDDKTAIGDKVAHLFAKPGQYIVRATGSQGGKEVVSEEVPVFVGIKPEEGLVCRLLMKGALSETMKSWIWLSNWDKVDYHFIPDASGSGNIGFLAGGTWVQDDKRGQVLELNGQRDRVELANTPDINAAPTYKNRTIAFWFKAAPWPRKLDKKFVQHRVLFEEGGPGAGINLYLDEGVLRAGIWKDGKGVWLDKDGIDTEWHHVAFVLRSSASDKEPAIELYLDGQKVGEGKAPALVAHTADINLGRSGSTLFHDGKAFGQPGFPFAGRFDDFRISNRALSAEEIQKLAKPK